MIRSLYLCNQIRPWRAGTQKTGGENIQGECPFRRRRWAASGDALAPCAGGQRPDSSSTGRRQTDQLGLKACPIQFDGHVRLDRRLCAPSDNAAAPTEFYCVVRRAVD